MIAHHDLGQRDVSLTKGRTRCANSPTMPCDDRTPIDAQQAQEKRNRRFQACYLLPFQNRLEPSPNIRLKCAAVDRCTVVRHAVAIMQSHTLFNHTRAEAVHNCSTLVTVVSEDEAALIGIAVGPVEERGVWRELLPSGL